MTKLALKMFKKSSSLNFVKKKKKIVCSYFGILTIWIKKKKTCTKISSVKMLNENNIMKDFSQKLQLYITMP